MSQHTTTPDTRDFIEAGRAADTLTAICHAANRTWWINLKTGEDMTSAAGQPPKVNIPEKLMLIVSEVAEGMEGHRKNLADDKLPHRKMLEVELADAVIRIFDLAGGVGLDVAGALAEKLNFNASRADHKPENRLAEGGKAY